MPTLDEQIKRQVPVFFLLTFDLEGDMVTSLSNKEYKMILYGEFTSKTTGNKAFFVADTVVLNPNSDVVVIRAPGRLEEKLNRADMLDFVLKHGETTVYRGNVV